MPPRPPFFPAGVGRHLGVVSSVHQLAVSLTPSADDFETNQLVLVHRTAAQGPSQNVIHLGGGLLIIHDRLLSLQLSGIECNISLKSQHSEGSTTDGELCLLVPGRGGGSIDNSNIEYANQLQPITKFNSCSDFGPFFQQKKK